MNYWNLMLASGVAVVFVMLMVLLVCAVCVWGIYCYMANVDPLEQSPDADAMLKKAHRELKQRSRLDGSAWATGKGPVT